MEDPHLGLPMEAPSNPNEYESNRIIAAVATVTFIATVTVAVRLYVRMKMLRSLGWDVSASCYCQKTLSTDIVTRMHSSL
jgi:hypothetical protein